MFEQEKAKIIESYIEGLEETIEQINMLRIFMTNADNGKIVSDINPIEARIESVIASYNSSEFHFKTNLIALYKKYNKPHPLKLEEIIENKEQKLKQLINDAKKEAKKIDKELFEAGGVNPLVYKDFLDWNLSLDFESLKTRYKELAQNPSKIKTTDSQIHATVIKALRKLMKTH